jgi:hypothetical protein
VLCDFLHIFSLECDDNNRRKNIVKKKRRNNILFYLALTLTIIKILSYTKFIIVGNYVK